jgi:5-methylcytosine-specific restriction endonuclease McrA
MTDIAYRSVGLPRKDPRYMAIWQEINKDLIAAKRKADYELNRESVLAKQKLYQARPDIQPRILAKAIRWQQENPERHNEKVAAWKAANPATVSANRAKRRARVLGAEGSHTKEEALALLEAQGYFCNNPYCEADLINVTPHLDHIVSLTRGGSNYASNLQWLCEPCNMRKHTTDWKDWLKLQALSYATKALVCD